MKAKYIINKIVNGIMINFRLFIKVTSISLIVVSEKIIIDNPKKKTKNLNFRKWIFSFDVMINKKGIKVKIGI